MAEQARILNDTNRMARVGGWVLDVTNHSVTWTDETYRIHEVPIDQSVSLDQAITFFNEEDRPRLTAAIDRAIRDGTPYDLELRFTTATGRQLWTHTKCQPERDDSGNVVRLNGVFQDITERKEAEVALQKSENRLQNVFDLLPVGLWFADREGTLLRGNPAGIKIWGAEPHVPISEYGVFSARRLPSGKPLQAGDWALAKTILEGATISDELLEIDAFDGQTKTILNYTAPILDDDDNVDGAVIINLDITDHRKLEDLLRQAQKDGGRRPIDGRLGPRPEQRVGDHRHERRNDG